MGDLSLAALLGPHKSKPKVGFWPAWGQSLDLAPAPKGNGPQAAAPPPLGADAWLGFYSGKPGKTAPSCFPAGAKKKARGAAPLGNDKHTCPSLWGPALSHAPRPEKTRIEPGGRPVGRPIKADVGGGPPVRR